MKKTFLTANLILFIMIYAAVAHAQISSRPAAAPWKAYPWTDSQLMEPSALAKSIADDDRKGIVILNIGAVEDIKDARHIGPVSNPENLKKLKEAVAGLPKNAEIVIYCGCCPFSKCPNIRPAFAELKELGFTDFKVLNLPVNLKTNWIADGFPLAK
ncbi:MAG TPA: hypothetical protein VHA56_14735 [Mucilaginibacter sp.]|nr:hypothetical protein [Mucilaginibacter sp.]